MSHPNMKCPELSHLQFAVLDCIRTKKISGRELRDLLAQNGHRKSGPSFYQMMSRLEESKFVKGEYRQKIVDGQIIKERLYSVTGSGERAFNLTIEFYRRTEEGKEALA
jgi:DNA-binding PadR family transcriptional regulator